MNIIINNVRYVNAEIQVNDLTISYGGEDYRYMANSPVLQGSALQEYVDSKEDQYVYGILYKMYPGARFKHLEGISDFEKLKTWIADGHTNAAYCQTGNPYCTIQSTSAYCEGSEGEDQATCELNGGTWIPEVLPPNNQADCEEAEGTWITTFDTEEKCLLAGGQWIPEQVIEKVPWIHSHDFTDDQIQRKLESIRAEAAYQIEFVGGYPQWFQSNVANGIYPNEVGVAMKNYIAAVITESNRCEDLIEIAETLDDALRVTPTWPEVV